MAYRDDLEAAQRKIEALEQELGATRDELEAVRSGKSRALAKVEAGGLAIREPEAKATSWWLGAPRRAGFEETLEGVLADEHLVELVEVARRHTGELGSTDRLEGSLAWTTAAPSSNSARLVTVQITTRSGRTTIRVEESYNHLVGGIFGGIGGGLGGGAAMVPISVIWLDPTLLAVTIPLWAGAVYGVCRSAYKRAVSGRRARLAELFDELLSVARERVRPAGEDRG